MACGCKLVEDNYLETYKNVAQWASGWGATGFDMLSAAVDVAAGMIGANSLLARQAMFSGLTKVIRNHLDCDHDCSTETDPYAIHMIRDQLKKYNVELTKDDIALECYPGFKEEFNCPPTVTLVISPFNGNLYEIDSNEMESEMDRFSRNTLVLGRLLESQLDSLVLQMKAGLSRRGDREFRFYIPDCLLSFNDTRVSQPADDSVPKLVRRTRFDELKDLFQSISTKYYFNLDVRFMIPAEHDFVRTPQSLKIEPDLASSDLKISLNKQPLSKE